MNQINYARVSGIIVQSCQGHGTWTDRDAGLRLVELFGSGGEDRLREIAARQEKEDLARTPRALDLVVAGAVGMGWIIVREARRSARRRLRVP